MSAQPKPTQPNSYSYGVKIPIKPIMQPIATGPTILFLNNSFQPFFFKILNISSFLSHVSNNLWNDNVINNQYKTLLNNSGSSLDSDSSNSGPYKTIVDLHDRNHIGTPMQDAWSQGLEGFTNEKQSTFSGYRNPDNPIYQKNLQDKNFSLEKQEKLFSQANKYNTELNNLYNKANMFSETNLSNNPYKGRNVSLSSGAKGYVTERNVFKWLR